MVPKFRSLIFTLLLLPSTLYGEGSKQLTPNTAGTAIYSMIDPRNTRTGFLAHDANLPSATGVATTSLSFLKPEGFSRNGVNYSSDHRLYIRVKPGETLYYGVRRAIHDQTNANQADLTITLRRTNALTGSDDNSYSTSTTLLRDQISTRDMLLSNTVRVGLFGSEAQRGVIQTPTQAQNGPNRPSIGGRPAITNGYAPLSITNNTNTDYDYYVEFTQVGESSWTDDGRRFSVYDLWDFTVIAANGDEKPGRMRSKLWSFSAGGANNFFSNIFPNVFSQVLTVFKSPAALRSEPQRCTPSPEVTPKSSVREEGKAEAGRLESSQKRRPS